MGARGPSCAGDAAPLHPYPPLHLQPHSTAPRCSATAQLWRDPQLPRPAAPLERAELYIFPFLHLWAAPGDVSAAGQGEQRQRCSVHCSDDPRGPRWQSQPNLPCPWHPTGQHLSSNASKKLSQREPKVLSKTETPCCPAPALQPSQGALPSQCPFRTAPAFGLPKQRLGTVCASPVLQERSSP